MYQLVSVERVCKFVSWHISTPPPPILTPLPTIKTCSRVHLPCMSSITLGMYTSGGSWFISASLRMLSMAVSVAKSPTPFSPKTSDCSASIPIACSAAATVAGSSGWSGWSGICLTMSGLMLVSTMGSVGVGTAGGAFWFSSTSASGGRALELELSPGWILKSMEAYTQPYRQDVWSPCYAFWAFCSFMPHAYKK